MGMKIAQCRGSKPKHGSGMGELHMGEGLPQTDQINMKREKTKMSSVLFDRNQKYQLYS